MIEEELRQRLHGTHGHFPDDFDWTHQPDLGINYYGLVFLLCDLNWPRIFILPVDIWEDLMGTTNPNCWDRDEDGGFFWIGPCQIRPDRPAKSPDKLHWKDARI